jgi:hypothetical protein
MRTVLFALFLALLSLPALADDQRPFATKPPEVSTYVKSDAPYGQGTLHKMFMKIYETSLWTDAKRWSETSTFALCIRYEMNFSAKTLVDRTFDELKHEGPVSDADRETYGAKLSKLYHDVHPGDVITAVFVPKKGAVFYYNGKEQGTLPNVAFAKRFFNIWLGPTSSEPELRDKLLAGK